MTTFRTMLALFALTSISAADKPSISLFDGKTLNGWEVCNGKASYRVEKGVVVGRTVEGSPNSFLCTKKDYGDFVLELETMTDPVLNSGIQIRSHRYAAETEVQTFDGKQTSARKQPAGRVHGYQVEISNEKEGTSGGIYDEARRGWLDNISSDPAASKAFKDEQWNKYKIEAIGDTIRVWVNGVPCAHLTDPVDQTGFIALQVHAFKGDKPAEVRFRNIRIQDLGRHVWKPIWDGKTLTGWASRGGGKFTIEDGAIHGQTVSGDERVAMLISDQSFKDLTVRVRFRMMKGNSGFFVRTDKTNMAAYEVEIDDAKGTGGFWETGPNGRKWVTGPPDNAAVKAGDWNEMTASLHGHRIAFHVNGIRTLFLPDDTAGRTEGHIGLQAHGAKRPTDVWFKDIAVLVPEK